MAAGAEIRKRAAATPALRRAAGSGRGGEDPGSPREHRPRAMQMLPVPVVVVFGLPPPDGVSSSSAPRRVAGIHAGDPVRQLRVDGGVHAADPVRVHPGDAVVEQRRVPALHPVETAGVQPVDTVEPHHLYGVHTGDPPRLAAPPCRRTYYTPSSPSEYSPSTLSSQAAATEYAPSTPSSSFAASPEYTPLTPSDYIPATPSSRADSAPDYTAATPAPASRATSPPDYTPATPSSRTDSTPDYTPSTPLPSSPLVSDAESRTSPHLKSTGSRCSSRASRITAGRIQRQLAFY
ncbi:hypothetical protein GQ55_3G317500 [Panicum hallii var. hallii]|uniref:Uncharacterized protein n=1 Tax=Panicum hallii var. hallii TaxID=1504633 RepID=A0A2T7EFB1_9POAL|nr:hypothetical protein GQ55_3G317500 [Panicum hallii var. hallii]